MSMSEMERGIALRAKIRTAIKHGLNFMLTGPHGIGKTQALLQMTREMREYKPIYVPLASISKDDLMIPYPVEEGGERFVRYLLHEIFDDRTPEGRKPIVLIFDEFNRNISDPQIYNTILEVTGTGTMGGRPVNLQCIIGLMNPTDDSLYFNTAELEITTIDRFKLFLRADGYDLGADEYLVNRFPETAPAMIEWYHTLPAEKKKLIPPRRQHSLLEVYEAGLDITDALLPDTQLPVTALIQTLEGGKVWTLRKMLERPDDAVSDLKENPSLLPVFYAIFRAVSDSKVALKLLPILRHLPPAVRQSLYQEKPGIWSNAILQLGKQFREEREKTKGNA